MFREWFVAVRLRLRALASRRQLDKDLRDEIEFHMAMMADQKRDRRQFGNAMLLRETCRELWGLGSLEILWQDLRHGARALRRSPGFTTVALLSLALGIGANTLIFSLLNAVMLKSLPVPDPQQLRVIQWTGRNVRMHHYMGTGMTESGNGLIRDTSLPYPAYRMFREHAPGSVELFAFSGIGGRPTVYRGQALMCDGMIVTGNFFRALGVKALLGRTLAPEDDRPAAEPVAVASYAWWERHSGLDSAVVGRRIILSGAAYTIVGVLPQGFVGPANGGNADFYVPMSEQPRILSINPLGAADHWWVTVMARVRAGVDERQMQAAFSVLFVPFAVSQSVMDQPGILISDGHGGPMGVRERLKRPFTLLMSIVGLVLLIACTNLASLLAARGAARRQEMALRVAIGAGRFRLVRQMLTESLLVSLGGGGLGLALAWLLRKSLVALVAPMEQIPQFDTSLDSRVLGFTFGLSVLAAAVLGLLPAMRAASADPAGGLKQLNSGGAPRLRLGRALVALQMGLSLLLLVVGGLCLRTLSSLASVDPGFRVERLLLFRLDAKAAIPDGRQLVAFYERVRESVAALPGVGGVTLSDVALISQSVSASTYVASGGQRVQANRLAVGNGFFDQLGIPLRLGRDFNDGDHEKAPNVAIVNEAFVRAAMPGRNPLAVSIGEGHELRIVGVCADAKYDSLEHAIVPTVYLPYRQEPASAGAMFFEVRTALPLAAVAPAIRRIVAGLNSSVPLTSMTTQTELIDRSLLPYRLGAALCGSFAVLALVLCAIGLYGVTAYTVARRTSEIGIRMALGAGRGVVLWMILREALCLAGIGLALGLLPAIGVTRLAAGMLYGVRFLEPTAIAGAVGLLLAVTATAALAPARRATAVDPHTALRNE